MLRNFSAKYGYYKKHKRILNGAEDSIKSIYDAAVFTADGRFDAARSNLMLHQE
ncbi:MAG: hypothetical protein MJ065_00405 [Oscillospiraceae bacterium]|nr:hypothetical protein [Oscillospiraceae bacterium]